MGNLESRASRASQAAQKPHTVRDSHPTHANGSECRHDEDECAKGGKTELSRKVTHPSTLPSFLPFPMNPPLSSTPAQ